jgi:hypothetical protein
MEETEQAIENYIYTNYVSKMDNRLKKYIDYQIAKHVIPLKGQIADLLLAVGVLTEINKEESTADKLLKYAGTINDVTFKEE